MTTKIKENPECKHKADAQNPNSDSNPRTGSKITNISNSQNCTSGIKTFKHQERSLSLVSEAKQILFVLQE